MRGWTGGRADSREMEIVPVFNPASPQAKAIVDFFYTVLGLCGVVLVVVTAIIGWSLVRFRAKPGQGEPRQVAGHTGLEVTWTLIPFGIVVLLFVLTARTMNRADPAPQHPDPDLIVIGHQWWWEARYPKSGLVTANEIHIPAGRRLLVRVESADVIHDLWEPRLNRKVDAVPGQPNYLWLEASAPGDFSGMCSEYCGNQHAWMWAWFRAEPAERFEQWQRELLEPAATPVSEPARRGAQLFQQLTCANCHPLRGTPSPGVLGPELAHLGERQTLGAGVIQNNPVELARWLKDPQQVKPGSLMPNLHLNEEQIAALVAYLEPEPRIAWSADARH